MAFTTDKQKLVDIMYQIAMAAASGMHGKNNEEIAEWVTAQLRGCGFDTYPCGSAWGVLKTSALENDIRSVFEDIQAAADRLRSLA
jgi:hypothetical protein